MKREGDFNKLIENINPETLPSHSHSLRAAAFYVQGLQCFFQARYNEAKYILLTVNNVFVIKKRSFFFETNQAIFKRDIENGQCRGFEPANVVFSGTPRSHFPIVGQ